MLTYVGWKAEHDHWQHFWRVELATDHFSREGVHEPNGLKCVTGDLITQLRRVCTSRPSRNQLDVVGNTVASIFAAASALAARQAKWATDCKCSSILVFSIVSGRNLATLAWWCYLVSSSSVVTTILHTESAQPLGGVEAWMGQTNQNCSNAVAIATSDWL